MVRSIHFILRQSFCFFLNVFTCGCVLVCVCEREWESVCVECVYVCAWESERVCVGVKVSVYPIWVIIDTLSEQFFSIFFSPSFTIEEEDLNFWAKFRFHVFFSRCNEIWESLSINFQSSYYIIIGWAVPVFITRGGIINNLDQNNNWIMPYLVIVLVYA